MERSLDAYNSSGVGVPLPLRRINLRSKRGRWGCYCSRKCIAHEGDADVDAGPYSGPEGRNKFIALKRCTGWNLRSCYESVSSPCALSKLDQASGLIIPEYKETTCAKNPHSGYSIQYRNQQQHVLRLVYNVHQSLSGARLGAELFGRKPNEGDASTLGFHKFRLNRG